MSLRPRFTLQALMISAMFCSGTLAYAADPITDLMLATNASYRVALYKTNSKAQTDALQALTQAQQNWDNLSAQYAARPVAPYELDPAFASAVAAVAKVFTKALAEINANDLPGAHNTLEEAREIMADMRQRSQVVVFSDHMNAYHSQMELLMTEGVDTLAQPQGLLRLAGQTGALSYLARRLSTQAAPSLAKDPQFTQLVDAVNSSVNTLEAALLKQDVAAIKDALGKLKGPYSKLFAKFG